ncbi:MAG: ATP-binding cassette domain-containing protein [Chloroflexi bacterium]|nr:ATP-binding cassette domain-containing protein [Chloroflexota bacterium]
MAGSVLLDVRNLKKSYPVQKGFLKRVVGYVRAVDDVSFQVNQGETLGLVGESGCGKTTVARCILRAVEPSAGQTFFRVDDKMIDITKADKRELRIVRQNCQMIFQDPYSSLNPRKRVRDIIGEPLFVNGVALGKALDERVAQLMHAVGLPSEYMIRYPHAFSGGQRQRIGIARALALNPKLIICDEPVSALDVSVQAQMLNLLKDLQDEFGLTYIFISHDLGVVRHVSDRVAVMYLGRLVEIASSRELFRRPLHPYSQALLAAAPKPHPKYRGEIKVLEGEVTNPPVGVKGCLFRDRCPSCCDSCAEEYPPLRNVGSEAEPHLVACHLADQPDPVEEEIEE